MSHGQLHAAESRLDKNQNQQSASKENEQSNITKLTQSSSIQNIKQPSKKNLGMI